MKLLDLLETLAQQFVETPFRGFFRKRVHPADLAGGVAETIEAFVDDAPPDHPLPPCYRLAVNPRDYAALTRHVDCDALVTELYGFLTSLAVEIERGFAGPLRIILEQDGGVPPGQVQVTTVFEAIDEDSA